MDTFCSYCVFECMAGEAITCQVCGLVSEEKPEAVAWAVGDEAYLAIQLCDDGYEYTLFNADFGPYDGGVVDDPDRFMEDVLYDILSMYRLKGKTLYPMDYYDVIDRAYENGGF